MKVSVIIPCFNEGETVLTVVERVRRVTMPGGLISEVIVVDDGSTAGPPDSLRAYADRHPDVILHASPVNFGKGAAVRIGLALASGDIVVIQDADLELSPEEIPTLIAPIAGGACDVVYGSRFLEGRRHALSAAYLANRFLTWLTRLLYWTRLSDMETCYKTFRRSVLAGVRLRAVGFEIEPELTAKFLRLGHRIHEVPVSYTPRTHAEGKKIRAWDGVKAIYYLFKYRLQPRKRFTQPRRDSKGSA